MRGGEKLEYEPMSFTYPDLSSELNKVRQELLPLSRNDMQLENTLNLMLMNLDSIYGAWQMKEVEGRPLHRKDVMNHMQYLLHRVASYLTRTGMNLRKDELFGG